MAKYTVEYSGTIEVEADCELEAECNATFDCKPENCSVIQWPDEVEEQPHERT